MNADQEEIVKLPELPRLKTSGHREIGKAKALTRINADGEEIVKIAEIAKDRREEEKLQRTRRNAKGDQVTRLDAIV